MQKEKYHIFFFVLFTSFSLFLMSCRSTTRLNKRGESSSCIEEPSSLDLLETGEFELLKKDEEKFNLTQAKKSVKSVTGSFLQRKRECHKILRLDLDFKEAQAVDFVFYRICDQNKNCLPDRSYLDKKVNDFKDPLDH